MGKGLPKGNPLKSKGLGGLLLPIKHLPRKDFKPLKTQASMRPIYLGGWFSDLNREMAIISTGNYLGIIP
jgi:hypothetical protein